MSGTRKNLAHHAERLYSILERLGSAGWCRRLADCSGRDGWPGRGVYFFSEQGEFRSAEPNVPRVVRVGTHAVSAGSKSTLWGRLRGHRGSRDGRGNHRGSIFRLHVGQALLRGEGANLESWGVRTSASRDIRLLEAEHERRVSDYLGAMTVTWIAVPDDPGPNSLRSYIERNSIALLSNGLEPPDSPSPSWLGRHSPREEIRRSGLWNLDYVREQYDPAFLETLEELTREVPSPHG